MKFTKIFIVAASLTFFGCSMQKMAGKSMLEFSKENTVVELMASDDPKAACTMSLSMGPVLSSMSRIDIDPEEVLVGTHLASAMCAEIDQREAELEKYRALYKKDPVAAKDASIVEKEWHRLAAVRFEAAYNAAVKGFSLRPDACPKLKDETDQALALLGLASGTLAVLHDFNAEKSANISLDIPRNVAAVAECFDGKTWWGLPDALKAAVWMTIPGSGPESVNPLDVLRAAAGTGDAQGVSLSRAIYAMMSANVGDKDRLCRLIENSDKQKISEQWKLLDSYGKALIKHQADLIWTQHAGHRSPVNTYACPITDEDVALSDELLEGLDDIVEGNSEEDRGLSE